MEGTPHGGSNSRCAAWGNSMQTAKAPLLKDPSAPSTKYTSDEGFAGIPKHFIAHC